MCLSKQLNQKNKCVKTVTDNSRNDWSNRTTSECQWIFSVKCKHFFFLNPITKNWHSSETSVFSVCSVSMIPIQKHMNLQRANILSTHPISLSLPLFSRNSPPSASHTHTGARSADQSPWIGLMAPRAPLLTKVLPKMMSYWEIMLGCYFNCRMLMHFVNADL